MLNRTALTGAFSIEKVLLLVAGVGSIAFIVSLVAIYDNSFVHPDFFRYILPETLRSGLPMGWSDVVNSLQLRSPGEFRPRFLAYFIQALEQKCRLFFYEFVLLPPTFSPISFALELIVGPYFLFRAIYNLTRDRQAAIAATIVYTSTIGFLCGITMVLLQGKNLSNVVLIICIYLASDIVRRESDDVRLLYQSNGYHKYLLLLFVFLGLFLDEMPIFVFCLIPILFPRLFSQPAFRCVEWRRVFFNGMFFILPALIFLAIVILLVPTITERYFGFRFDYLGNTLLLGQNTRGAKSVLEGPYGRFSWSLVLENALTLFGFAAVPSQISPFIKSDYGDYPGTQAANVAKWVIVFGTIAIAAALATIGNDPARGYLRSMPGVFVSLFVFLSLLSIRHIPITTGFYYGAIFAVMFAVFIGLCYGSIDHSRSAMRASAAVIILLLVFIGTNNFSKVNRAWIVTHNEVLIRGSFQSIVQLSEPRTLRRQELHDIWRAWKRGELTRYLDATAISTGAVYLVAELQALDKARLGTNPPRHQLVNYSGY